MAGGDRNNANEALILALASGVTVEAAARQAGVSERTAHRRMKDPSFRQRIHQVRAEMVGQGAGRLTAAAMNAIDTLQGLLAAESESVRLGAATKIIELGSKLREGAEMEERIAALEQALRDKDDANDKGKPGEETGFAGGPGQHEDGDHECRSAPPTAGSGTHHDPGGDDGGCLADDVTPLPG